MSGVDRKRFVRQNCLQEFDSGIFRYHEREPRPASKYYIGNRIPAYFGRFWNREDATDYMDTANPLRNMPGRVVIVFLLAVFFTFVAVGVANDVIDMGRQLPLRFGLALLVNGILAVCYAVAGVSLRSRMWKAFIPLFILQMVLMSALASWVPDAPHRSQLDETETRHLEQRLIFDGVATIVTLCLGYAGFVHVFIRESRRHIKASAEKAVLEAEMAAAREVQQVIVPERGESFPGYIVESVYQPATQVGGDFFQILPVDKAGLLLVIGDVAGKGLPAAMLVSMLVGCIRTASEYTHEPALMLRKVNDRLLGHTCGGFATALAAHVDGDGMVTIANAGHLSPYLDGREVELAGALPLGIAASGIFETQRFELRPGSRLAFYSDGVIEAQSKSGELFGFERAKAISTKPAAEIVKEAIAFGQEDDITVVTIERLSGKDNGSNARSAEATTITS
jgi:Stage II sporulation protein E (SpoIIE)